MSKIKITFELDSIEDRDEIKRIMQRDDAFHCLNELADYLRHLNKYAEKETIKIEEIHAKFWEILNEHQLEL